MKKLTAVFAAFMIALFGLSLTASPVNATASTKDPIKIQNGLNQTQSYGGIRGGDIPTFVGTIVRWLLGLIGVILIAMFVYGGVMYATSAGNDERVETGKKIMIYAVIGTAIIAIAFIASDFVLNALFDAGQQGSAF